MTVQIPDGFTVENLPIEHIERGDTVIGYAGEDLTEFLFEVDELGLLQQKRGEPVRIELRSARESDANGTGLVATITRPMGTLIGRIVPQVKETAL